MLVKGKRSNYLQGRCTKHGARYDGRMNTMQRSVGDVLREWRQRRHLSQLDLANEAEISARHLSFVETGRSKPSRDMLVHLADHLRVPLRDRNDLLLAGGYAPVYPERSLDALSMAVARQAVDVMLTGHEPYPALAIDRHWNLISANRALGLLLTGVAPGLLEPPVNVMRLSLHPNGLASRIVNITEWREHLIGRLRFEIDVGGDPLLIDLAKEVGAYPVSNHATTATPNATGLSAMAGLVVPFQLRTEASILSFFSATTVFGTATEVTLSELAIESFFPVDRATADTMHHLMANDGNQGTRELTTDE